MKCSMSNDWVGLPNYGGYTCTMTANGHVHCPRNSRYPTACYRAPHSHNILWRIAGRPNTPHVVHVVTDPQLLQHYSEGPLLLQRANRGRGGGCSGEGKSRRPPIFSALCTAAGTRVRGIHSGHTIKKSFGIRNAYIEENRIILRDTQEEFPETRTSTQTDPDTQYTGTSTPLEKKSADPRSNKWPGSRKQFRGETLGTKSEKQNPRLQSPPPFSNGVTAVESQPRQCRSVSPQSTVPRIGSAATIRIRATPPAHHCKAPPPTPTPSVEAPETWAQERSAGGPGREEPNGTGAQC